MLNIIIKARNLLLSLHVFFPLNLLNTILLLITRLLFIVNIALKFRKLIKMLIILFLSEN